MGLSSRAMSCGCQERKILGEGKKSRDGVLASCPLVNHQILALEINHLRVPEPHYPVLRISMLEPNVCNEPRLVKPRLVTFTIYDVSNFELCNHLLETGELLSVHEETLHNGEENV